MIKINQLLKEIDALKGKIDRKRPLSHSELQELQKWYLTTYTYHTNALEGNSLTLEETRVVVEDGLTVEGKPLRHVFEAKNHKDALNQLFLLVKQKKDITEAVVLKLHKEFLKGIDEENAGVYRKVRVSITGEEKIPPSAKKVPQLMQGLFKWYNENKAELHPVVLAAEFHLRFVKIHPFIDGNGRIARLVANLVLLQHGYPLVIIPTILRRKYMTSLKGYQPKEKVIGFFTEVTKENMQDYLRMIEG